MQTSKFRWLGVLTALGLLLAAPLAAKEEKTPKTSKGQVNCTMQFELHSWAVFYKSGKGGGSITCDNGQRSDILVRTHGGGIQFGKFNIANGSGKFTPVKSIDQLFGKWATVGGQGAVVKARIGQSLSKDDITLDIKGTGTGGGFGFDFGSFRITPITPAQAKALATEKAEQEKMEQQEKEAEKAAKKKKDN